MASISAALPDPYKINKYPCTNKPYMIHTHKIF